MHEIFLVVFVVVPLDNNKNRHINLWLLYAARRAHVKLDSVQRCDFKVCHRFYKKIQVHGLFGRFVYEIVYVYRVDSIVSRCRRLTLYRDFAYLAI